VVALAGGEHRARELPGPDGALIRVAPDRGGPLAGAIDVLQQQPRTRAAMAAAARDYTREQLGPAEAGVRLEAIAARTLSPALTRTRPARTTRSGNHLR
jgi:hypothetical protein